MPADTVAIRSRADAGAPGRTSAESAAIRVLVVDDHPPVRAGVESVIATEHDLVCVASAATAAEALEAAERLSPEVVVLDYQLGSTDGLTVTRRLKALPVPPRVLLYSAYADSTLALLALVADADGLLNKSSRGYDVCDAIRRLAAGHPALPRIAGSTLRTVGERLDPDDLAIIGMLVHGTTHRDIAAVLGMSERWLDARRWSMIERLTSDLNPRTAAKRGVRAR